jgi:hypothetical protein
MKRTPRTFRFSILLLYIIVGALLWSAYFAFIDSMPPEREIIGDAAFRLAWRRIPLVGAHVGLIGYTVPVLFSNIPLRRYTVRGLLIGTSVVAIELGLLVCTYRR